MLPLAMSCNTIQMPKQDLQEKIMGGKKISIRASQLIRLENEVQLFSQMEFVVIWEFQ